MYNNRLIEDKLISLSNSFSIVMLQGPMGVGKTTLMLKNKPSNMKYVDLANLELRSEAINALKYFLSKYGTPLLIDNIIYAPNLFNYFKIIVDNYLYN